MDAQAAVLISGIVAVVAALLVFIVTGLYRRSRPSESGSPLLEAGAFSLLCGLAVGGITLVILV